MKRKIRIGIAVFGVMLLGVLLKLFVIGEPIDGHQLAYQITQDGAVLELQVSAEESAVALRGWKLEQEGSDLFIHARKVPVSFLFSSGAYQTAIHTDGINTVYLGGQMIWNGKSTSGKVQP